MTSSAALLALARKHGTPAYVYDGAVIREKVNQLRRTFAGFEILYAVKANPNPKLLAFMRNLGAGADVASEGELKAALAAGIAVSRISFAGPGKERGALAFAVKKGIAALSVESCEEMRHLNDEARKAGKTAAVTLRINPLASPGKAGLRMSGALPSQFGIPEEELPEALSLLGKLRHLCFRGIHVYAGSQILDYRTIAEHFHIVLDLWGKLPEDMKEKTSIVNFGGGFGVPYFEGERALDLKALASEIKKLHKREEMKILSRHARLFIEPGRFLAAECGTYLTSVLYRKECRGKIFIVTDGGMNHHLAAAGLLGAVIRKNYPIKVLTAGSKRKNETVDIAGPCCTPLDSLARNVTLPAPQRDDILAVLNSGAYGLTASPVNFLSHTPPKEHIVYSPRSR